MEFNELNETKESGVAGSLRKREKASKQTNTQKHAHTFNNNNMMNEGKKIRIRHKCFCMPDSTTFEKASILDIIHSNFSSSYAPLFSSPFFSLLVSFNLMLS